MRTRLRLGVTGVVNDLQRATRQGLISAGDSPHYYLERQAVFVGLGIVVMYVVSLIDYRRLEIVTTPPAGLLSLLSLAGVYVVGSSAQGALRWYSIGIFQIQPSEFTVELISHPGRSRRTVSGDRTGSTMRTTSPGC